VDKLRFEWNSRKNKANTNKHKISFEEAKTVFLDERAAIANDPDHSDNEDRYIIIGFSSAACPLLVCFCERDEGNTIRIISARKLTKKEIKQFNQGWKK